jgi:hypothetical protein
MTGPQQSSNSLTCQPTTHHFTQQNWTPSHINRQSVRLDTKPLETHNQQFFLSDERMVCHLQLLLVLTSTVILKSEFHGTHDHILLSQIRNSPNQEEQAPVFISPRNRVTQFYPQALGSLFVAFYDLQDYGGGIRPCLHTGYVIATQPSNSCCLQNHYLPRLLYNCLSRGCCLAVDLHATILSIIVQMLSYGDKNGERNWFWPELTHVREKLTTFLGLSLQQTLFFIFHFLLQCVDWE